MVFVIYMYYRVSLDPCATVKIYTQMHLVIYVKKIIAHHGIHSEVKIEQGL